MNMNRLHRLYCRSARWQRTLREALLPWVLGRVESSGEVLELGAGPGLTTALLCERFARVTAVELDPALAAEARRHVGSRARIVEADATRLPFEDASFAVVVCFTMLHHVPSPALQDRLFAEALRTLAPGGLFAGSDSVSTPLFRLVHLGDVLVAVDPAGLGRRLEAAGFVDVRVDAERRAFRFRARKPPADAYDARAAP